MASFDLNTLNSALENSEEIPTGVDFSGKSLKLDSAKDAQPIVEAINKCPNLQYLTLTGNTLGVTAAEAISKALAEHPELKICRFSDMFTGRMKTEIPPALSALGEGMIAAGARLSVLDLSDNAFGPIGVEGLAKLLQSDVCSELEELRLNNNGLGITGGKLLASALAARPRRLKIFVAGRNRLENDGATALAKVFKSMGTLEEVAMPQNGIYHVGVSALSEAFKHNPQLTRLNLNDNTVGVKGAAAVADALPKLRNLKAVNFGDCLLKSKGAKALAKAFRDNSLLVESLDLSHNEIGHEACMEVVDALTVLPDSQDRLTRVVLAGNSLGSATYKSSMRSKLGACAELSGDEDSDDEYVTDSEADGSESDPESDASDKTEDSATEDSRDLSATLLDQRDITIDTSIVEEVETDVGNFLKEPTAENLRKLGPNAAEVIDAHLQAIKSPRDFIQAYVEATFLVSSIPDQTVARAMWKLLWEATNSRRAYEALTDFVLMGLKLEKSKDPNYKIRWSLPECYDVLGTVVLEDYFLHTLRDLIRYLISCRREYLSPVIREAIKNPTDFINAYVEATLLVSGIRDQTVACAMYPLLMAATHARHAMQWVLIDNFLKGLQLIKSEDKKYKIRWSLPECYNVLGTVFNEDYFSHTLKDTIRYFISSKKDTLSPEIRAVIQKHESLHRY